MDQHQQQNVPYTPQTCTPILSCKTKRRRSMSLDRLCLCPARKIEAKVKRTVTFAPCDHPPDDVVKRVTQSHLSVSTPRQKISVTFIQTDTHLQNKTDAVAKPNIRLSPQPVSYSSSMVLTYCSTIIRRCGPFHLQAELYCSSLD